MKLALLASLLLLTSNADADCALSGLVAKPVSSPMKSIPRDGGIVIAAVSDPKGTLDPGDAALMHTFKLDGGTTLALAPGLAVIRVTRSGNLLDRKGTPVLAVTTSKPLLPLPAPEVKVVEHQAWHSRRGVEYVYVTFERAMSGIAVVLADAKGTPRSWGLVNGEALRVAAYSQHDCMALPNGTTPSKLGETVTVRYVDVYGRLSPPSKPIKIVAAKETP